MRKRRYKVNNKSKAIGRILVLLAGLLIIAGLIFGIVKLLSSGKKKSRGLSELPFTAAANYAYTGAGFLYFDAGRLYYEDIADASKDTSYKINTEELKLAASKGISVLYHDTALQIDLPYILDRRAERLQDIELFFSLEVVQRLREEPHKRGDAENQQRDAYHPDIFIIPSKVQ